MISLSLLVGSCTTMSSTLSLHDALPIYRAAVAGHGEADLGGGAVAVVGEALDEDRDAVRAVRSEEHTSELQSHVNLVCRLLLEKKNSRDQGRATQSADAWGSRSSVRFTENYQRS